MAYLGDIRLGDTIDFHSTTRQISGAPSTLSSSPVLSCYPANSTTEITAGITLDVDFDSRTGLNHIRIVASSGNGYATATDYSVVITTGTVNSVSVVGEVIGNFSIEHRSALMPATAARTLVVDAAGLADGTMVKMGPTGSGTAQTARDIGANVLLSSGTGTGQLDFTSGVVKANLAQILGTALTETAGQLAGAFKKFFNIAAPASTMDALTLVATATALTTNNDKTGYALTGAQSISSLAISGNMTMGNLTNNGTTTLSGAVSLGSTLGVTGATTLTGAVTATNGGNSITGVTAAVTGNVTVGTNNDKTGYALTSAYDAAKTAGDATAANQSTINTNVLSRLATSSYTAPDSAATIAAAVWASTMAGTTTATQAMRGFIAALLGKASGLDSNSPKYRDVADSKDVISATTDSDGNRTAVTLDLS